MPPRIPASAVITKLLSQSWIRPASASGLKPPNTTEWIAPIRLTGEHGHGRFRDHRHVDGDPVPAPGPQRLERIRHAADFLVQFAVSQLALLAGVIAFPDDRGNVAALRQMAIKAVGRNVERTVGEPFDPEVGLVNEHWLSLVHGLIQSIRADSSRQKASGASSDLRYFSA